MSVTVYLADGAKLRKAAIACIASDSDVVSEEEVEVGADKLTMGTSDDSEFPRLEA